MDLLSILGTKMSSDPTRVGPLELVPEIQALKAERGAAILAPET
jgi:hypothetical protein